MNRLTLLFALAAFPAFSGDLVGRVTHIRDGDTLEEPASRCGSTA